MNLRVYVWPSGNDGILRVTDAMRMYLPQYGVDVVDDPDQADIINNHGTSLTERPGVPMVSSCHGLMWSDYQWPRWAQLINRQVRESIIRADAHTAPSQWVRAAMVRGVLCDPKVIHHGVDAPPEVLEASGYVLWNKARTDPVSDQHDMDRVAERLPNVPFVSTFGQEKPNVILIGNRPYAEMLATVQRASVYLATARETFGIATLEALAAGVPVAGFRWGGQAEIIREGETGYLAEPHDYDGLARCVERCLAERDRLSLNARQDALERWRWQDKIGQYAELFKEVAYAHRQPRPYVSVIVTFHNLGRYLRQTVASVASQGYKDWELVLVDDASSSEEAAVARECAALDGRIRLVRSDTNLGLSGARNSGIAHSRGRYILPLDADDALAPGALGVLAGELDRERATHIAYGHLDLIDEDGGNQRRNNWPNDQFSWAGQIAHLNQLPYSAMIRREVFERCGGYRVRDWRAEDAPWWIRATSFGYRAKKVTEAATLLYRIRSDSKSQRDYKEADENGYRDGDWTAWFPWNRSRRRQGTMPPWGAQGDPIQLGIQQDMWPVPSQASPLVSVVIPVGPGHGKYLVDALDSVMAQTMGDWEAIVVNDTGDKWGGPTEWGSPVHGFPWARVLDLGGNKGASAARNAGIAAARAPLLAFLDADDILLPGFLEKTLQAHRRHGGLIYTDWMRTKPDDTARQGTILDKHETDDFSCGAVLGQMRHAMTVLVPKAAAQEAGGFDDRFAGWEDWDFLIGVQVAGWTSQRVPEPLFVYRFHSGTLRERAFSRKEEMLALIRGKWSDYYDGTKKLMA